MCWSFEVSLGSFIAILVVGSYLARYPRPGTNDRWIGLFVLWIGLVQLFEAMQWADQGCSLNVNEMATLALFVVIMLEPLVHSLIALKFGNRPWLATTLVCLSVAFALYGALAFAPRENQMCTRPTCRHLDWQWVRNAPNWYWAVFVILLTAPLLAMPTDRWIYILFVFGILALAWIQEGFSSLWCFYGIFTAALPFLIE